MCIDANKAWKYILKRNNRQCVTCNMGDPWFFLSLHMIPLREATQPLKYILTESLVCDHKIILYLVCLIDWSIGWFLTPLVEHS